MVKLKDFIVYVAATVQGWERRKARTGRRRGTKRGEISRGEIQWGEAKEEMHLSRHGPTVTLLGLGMGLGTPNL